MKAAVGSALRPYRRHLAVILFCIIFLLLFIPTLTYFYFANDLKTKDSIMNRNEQGVVLTDRKDRTFFTFYNGKYRTSVSLDKIPAFVRLAVITSEDRNFYHHQGFSPKGIARSLFLNVSHKQLGYGGSTITQQLVKNALLKPTKSFLRKYQEIVLASEIERRYSKNEILEMYLNSVYLGAGAFGFEEGAQVYFGKPASKLTLSEAALLAGILPAPSALSPYTGDREKALFKERLVLQEMYDQKYITKTELEQAKKQTLSFGTEKELVNSLAPHFALMVRDELIHNFGEEQVIRSGYKVKTTLDLDLQQFAEKTVKEQVENLKSNNVSNGAAVVEDPKTGEILALVGSKDWYDNTFGKVNIATSRRQPGSSFKPIVYAAAMEQGWLTPATVLHDDPISYDLHPGVYKPVDYDRKNRGQVLARRALANSLNIPAVEVIAKLGVPQAVEMAQSMGLTTVTDPTNYGLSLVLGAAEVKLLEHTNVYATFANNGYKHTPTEILEIDDKNGRPVYQHQPHQEQVLKPATAFLISSILSDNQARQEEFGNTLTISRPAAVKTGTTDDYKDAWTLGYTSSVVVGVWVGNNDGQPMDRVAGSLGAAPIWRLLMEHFLAETPIETFQQPADVVTLGVCKNNGLRVKEATSSAITEYFVRGSEPTAVCFVPTISPSPGLIQPTQSGEKTPSKKKE